MDTRYRNLKEQFPEPESNVTLFDEVLQAIEEEVASEDTKAKIYSRLIDNYPQTENIIRDENSIETK